MSRQRFHIGCLSRGTFGVAAIRFERDPIGDLVEPAPDRFFPNNGAGLAHERQERGLKGIFRILRLGLNPNREALYERINLRAQQMFQNGLVEETRSLLDRYGAANALNSLGYRQAAQYLQGELTVEQAITLAQQGHRNYAKRQMTWFRREPDVHWISGFGFELEAQKDALKFVQENLD